MDSGWNTFSEARIGDLTIGEGKNSPLGSDSDRYFQCDCFHPRSVMTRIAGGFR